LKEDVLNEEMLLFVTDSHMQDIDAAIKQMAKSERSIALRNLRKRR